MVVTIADPPENFLRPGLSTTAKIKTAKKKNVLAIPYPGACGSHA